MRPLVIIGAGRSGTNALRDALVTLPEMSTWPCDEINYIWRSGNRDHPTDELKRSHARPEVATFIRRSFLRQAAKQPHTHLVEKTCANSLRVEFVDAIFPESIFIHIQRDGRDVVSSAMPRWTAPLDVPYLVRKARYVPIRDLPHYGLRYLRSRLARPFSNDHRLSTWGPRFEGLDELARSEPLEVVCAEQWARCVESAQHQLRTIAPQRLINVRYEGLVNDPATTLGQILESCEIETSADSLRLAAATVRNGSVGAWTRRLTDDAMERIEPIVQRIEPASAP